ncbi:urea ABC transporter ATP-binding subunit UrtE [Sulfurovum sp.]|uniref:urea ABC transporter ATP-binding subunit UrtE n=1 Tax=Sulfurovum sp. TaxID=1969726 RepID=UPI003569C6DC
MITINKLNQFYAQSHTLWDLSLEIEPGKCTCIMGRNGVGKTTLAKAIMGLLLVKDGEVMFEGQNICELSSDKRADLGIGYVPQGREIFSQLTVSENLKIGLYGNRNGLKKVPEKIFELFPVLKEMLQRKGGDLSGGQQQQLAIARALCLEPKVLILDEPSEGIQPNIVQQIGGVIDYLTKEEKLTVILVEQKLPFARRHGDNFFIMERGQVAAKGSMDELNDAIVEKFLSV